MHLRLFLFALVLFSPLQLFAQKSPQGQGPFPFRTQHPVYLQTIQLLPERPQTLPAGVFEARVDSSYSNIFERVFGTTDELNIDMELERLGFVFAYGLPQNWEVGVEIPLLHFGGGFMDSFVQSFHNAFGFPNGGRGLVPNDEFHYSIKKNNQVIYQVANSQNVNVGDVTLTAKYFFQEETRKFPAMALRFGFKLPTGDEDLGSGSGNAGFGLGTAIEKSYKRLRGYGNFNYSVDGGNEALEEYMYNEYFDYSLAGEYVFSKWISAIFQLVGGTPRLKNFGYHPWDAPPIDMIIGLRGEVPLKKRLQKFFWQASFAEDVIATGPSVDFSIWLSVGFKWDSNHFAAKKN